MTEAAGKPRRSRLRVLMIAVWVVAVVAVGLIAAEIYMRKTRSYIIMDVDSLNKKLADANVDQRFFVKYTLNGRRLAPNVRSRIVNHDLSHRTVEIRVNSLGFRGDEVPVPKPPGQLRVLALGDSITLGSYLPEDEIYVGRLEQYLDQALAPRDALVVNAGVVDVGIKEEMDIFEESGFKVEPDIVVVGFYLNDMRPPYGFPGEKNTPGLIRRHSVLIQFLYQRLEWRKYFKDHGMRRFTMDDHVAKDKWITDHDEFRRIADKARMDWGSAWEEAPWKIVDREFERLARHQKERGFKVVIVMFPVYFQVYSEFLDDRPQQIMAQKAAEHGFYFLDLLPGFRAAKDRALFYDQCHLQPDGNDIAGREISDHIVTRVLTP